MKGSITLMYHDVFLSSPMESGFKTNSSKIYKLHVDDFEEQVSKISNYCEQHRILKRNVLFSFDDGGSSNLYVIAPILEKYDLRGLFFITSDRINTDGFLDDKQIQELDKRGHIIGAHSHSHPINMKALSDDVLFQEWSTSCAILEHILNKPITLASIPGGSASNRVFEIMGKCGIREIYTSFPGIGASKYHGISIYYRYAIKKKMPTSYVLSIITSRSTRNQILVKKHILNLLRLMLGKYYFLLRTILLSGKKA